MDYSALIESELHVDVLAEHVDEGSAFFHFFVSSRIYFQIVDVQQAVYLFFLDLVSDVVSLEEIGDGGEGEAE